MLHAAAEAIAAAVPKAEIAADYIIPSVLNRQVTKEVAMAVVRAAHKTHVSHREPKGTSLYHT